MQEYGVAISNEKRFFEILTELLSVYGDWLWVGSASVIVKETIEIVLGLNLPLSVILVSHFFVIFASFALLLSAASRSQFRVP